MDDFVNSVNYSLKQRQDNERMNGIIARIESYDIVVSTIFPSPYISLLKF